MTDPKKTGEEFTADMLAYIDTGATFRKAAMLAYNESARVTAELCIAVAAGRPVDLQNLLNDCDGCKVLGERAAAAEKAWHVASDNFYGWAKKFGAKR